MPRTRRQPWITADLPDLIPVTRPNMGKYLLLLAGVLVVYWMVRSSLRRRSRVERQNEAPSAETEKMVRCAECGVHLPRGESLVVRGQFYCCAEHQRRHDPGNPGS